MANPVSQFQLTDLFNMTNFNSKITDTNTYIETLVEEAKQAGVKIATGSYVGTGTYGADNPCSLTFDFEPVFAIISRYKNAGLNDMFLPKSGYWQAGLIWHSGSGAVLVYNSEYYPTYVSVSNKTLSWYNNNDANRQLNKSENEYGYTVIGQ